MRTRLLRILSLFVVTGTLSVPAWAQAPMVQPLPEPVPLGAPSEGLPPPPPPPTVQAQIIQNLGGGNDNCGSQPQGYWTVGGGAYVLRPFFGNNPAFSIAAPGVAPGSIITKQTNLNQRLNVAPIGFLSYTFASGLGIRGRWFQFNSDGSASAIAAAGSVVTIPSAASSGVGANSTLNASSSLRMSVYDVEGTYVLGNEQFCVLLAAGGRYTFVGQSYQLNVNDPSGLGTAGFGANHSFTGWGPTMAIECRKQICNSCFALFANARGSVLFGTGSSDGSESFTSKGVPVTLTGSANQHMVLPIGELEIGGEVAYVWGRFRFFGQLGAVGQIWWGAGNASQGLDLATGTGVIINGANNNFGLLGLVARAGVNF